MRTRHISWFTRLRQQWRRLSAAPLVVWDVGAVTTRVHIGQKLVFSEATCVALHTQRQHVLSYGDNAYRLLGNSGKQLTVLFPVDRSCLTDTRLATIWLEYLRTQLWPRRRFLAGLRAPAGMLCLGEGVGAADAAEWKSALDGAGLQAVSTFPGLVGLSWYLNVATSQEPCLVIDMGGSQTQIGILVQGELFSSDTLGRGGIDLTTLVQAWLMQEYRCQVSWRVAEKLKCTSGTLAKQEGKTKKMAIKGKDPYTHLGTTALVDVSLLQAMLVDAQRDLILFIRQFLASVPSEIATKCLEQGVWLTGGASLLSGIDDWLSTALGTPVSRVQEPLIATSKGIAIWSASLAAKKRTV